MILDAIIGLVISLIIVAFEAVLVSCVFAVNLLLAGFEAVVGLFVAGYSVGRLEKPRRFRNGEGPARRGPRWVSHVVLLTVAISLVWILAGNKITKREISFVARDGHGLPFAEVIVLKSGGGEKRMRSNNAGIAAIPRFGVEAIAINDPRYVKQTWAVSEIDGPLVVRRTVLGSSLDHLADRLLKPAEEDDGR